MSTIAASRIKYLQSRICRFDDQLAYKEVYLNFYPSLLLFISGIIKSKQYAEELVSDLFIKIWEKRKTLEEIQNFACTVLLLPAISASTNWKKCGFSARPVWTDISKALRIQTLTRNN